MKKISSAILLLFLFILSCKNENSPENQIFSTEYTIIYSVKKTDGTLQLHINTVNSETLQTGTPRVLTSGHKDFKPSCSKDGTKVAFFRLISGDVSNPITIKSKLCVINFDGTGFRELTDSTDANVNPTFTRDGTNSIIFIRGYQSTGKWVSFIINPEGNIGTELSITDVSKSEAAFTCLSNGKVIANYASGLCLISINPGNTGVYQHLTRDTYRIWSHFSLSPDESRIVTEEAFVAFGSTPAWEDYSVSIANINFTTNTISNLKSIVTPSPLYWDGYPRWSSDNRYVIFHSAKTGIYKLYVYYPETGTVNALALPEGCQYLYASFKNAPV